MEEEACELYLPVSVGQATTFPLSGIYVRGTHLSSAISDHSYLSLFCVWEVTHV